MWYIVCCRKAALRNNRDCNGAALSADCYQLQLHSCFTVSFTCLYLTHRTQRCAYVGVDSNRNNCLNLLFGVINVGCIIWSVLYVQTKSRSFLFQTTSYFTSSSSGFRVEETSRKPENTALTLNLGRSSIGKKSAWREQNSAKAKQFSPTSHKICSYFIS